MTGLRRTLVRLPRAAVNAIREFGPIGGPQALFERAMAKLLAREDRRRDRALGLDTAAGATLSDLHVDSEHADDGFAYVASPVRLVRGVLRDLPVQDGEFTFVDLGSGKGRVLLIAAGCPFAEVIGVEFAQELHEVALANVARASERRGGGAPIRLHHGDAAAYDLPLRPLVLYLNNPFTEVVMTAVLANIERSLLAAPRPLFLIYQEARHEPASDRTANLALIAAAPFLHRRMMALPLLERFVLRAYRIEVFEATPDWRR